MRAAPKKRTLSSAFRVEAITGQTLDLAGKPTSTVRHHHVYCGDRNVGFARESDTGVEGHISCGPIGAALGDFDSVEDAIAAVERAAGPLVRALTGKKRLTVEQAQALVEGFAQAAA